MKKKVLTACDEQFMVFWNNFTMTLPKKQSFGFLTLAALQDFGRNVWIASRRSLLEELSKYGKRKKS
jgi:hypothetical protein